MLRSLPGTFPSATLVIPHGFGVAGEVYGRTCLHPDLTGGAAIAVRVRQNESLKAMDNTVRGWPPEALPDDLPRVRFEFDILRKSCIEDVTPA